ncbi:MAG: energy-coupling factor transporter transmembrane protein EcfT [Dehalococcoidia bacterium]|nr:energy-coupling factor transporter transmembrane protein EcfT [Dehalococcoidia bacterium]
MMATGAWCAWVLMVGAVALGTSNPLYLAVILLGVLLVAAMAPRTETAVAGFRTLLFFGLAMFAISLVIATINGSYGEHILFTMPGPDLPDWLGGLRLGGPVSAEGLAAAGIRGLAILCVLLAFGVFNGAVSPHQLLRTAPAALFHASLVVTVGLTLLPSSIEDVRRIREMRALRGAPGGLRQLPALVVPAVIGGLERSMRLAEAMEARGYAAAPPAARGPRLIGGLAAPLFLFAAVGWFYYSPLRLPAVLAALAGAGCIVAWGWGSSRARHTTRLRDEPTALIDSVLIVLSVGITVVALAGKSVGWVEMGYNPFAGLAMPPFEVPGALVALAAAWPAVRLAFATPVVPREEPPHAPAHVRVHQEQRP